MQMAKLSEYKSGTFTGDGTSSVALPIGFEPDILIMDTPVAWDESGWSGTGILTIAKGIYTIATRHSTTNSATVGNVVYIFNSSDGDYGNSDNANAYAFYCSYSNGVFTIENKTPGNATRFISGNTYTWKAYKA